MKKLLKLLWNKSFSLFMLLASIGLILSNQFAYELYNRVNSEKSMYFKAYTFALSKDEARVEIGRELIEFQKIGDLRDINKRVFILGNFFISKEELEKNRISAVKSVFMASKANLENLDLSGVDLSKNLNDERIDFSNSNFKNSKLDNANLANTSFKGSDFTGASFKNTDIKYADFTEANLTNAIFDDVDLEGVNLEGAILIGADFSKAKNLDKAKFKGEFYNSK